MATHTITGGHGHFPDPPFHWPHFWPGGGDPPGGGQDTITCGAGDDTAVNPGSATVPSGWTKLFDFFKDESISAGSSGDTQVGGKGFSSFFSDDGQDTFGGGSGHSVFSFDPSGPGSVGGSFFGDSVAPVSLSYFVDDGDSSSSSSSFSMDGGKTHVSLTGIITKTPHS
jgi:hypothetical protein